MILIKVLIGALTGILVGLSGVGGGVLLLPILIFGLGVPPIIAVGSDAAFNALTKVGAAVMHWRQGTVNWRLAGVLSMGSLPGALVGVGLLALLRQHFGGEVNQILRIVLGVLLLTIPLLLLFEGRFEKKFVQEHEKSPVSNLAIATLGAVSGFLVGISSVGSGSIVMIVLLLLMPGGAASLVGTDLIHGVALTGFSSLLHLKLGTVNSGLVLPLLVGSIPGSLLGVKLSRLFPNQWLRRILCLVLVASGARLLVP